MLVASFCMAVESKKLFSVTFEVIYGIIHPLCHFFAQVCISVSSTSAKIYESFTLSFLSDHR